jgi:hypothetical protein
VKDSVIVSSPQSLYSYAIRHVLVLTTTYFGPFFWPSSGRPIAHKTFLKFTFLSGLLVSLHWPRFTEWERLFSVVMFYVMPLLYKVN